MQEIRRADRFDPRLATEQRVLSEFYRAYADLLEAQGYDVRAARAPSPTDSVPAD
jgi:hypothetical protein